MGNLQQTRTLISQDDASMIARPDVARSTFKGSFARKFTFDAGLIIPFHVEEVYPGDHFKYRFTPFIRTQTPFLPVMDSQRIDIHCFFVPNRLVWVNWVKLMGQQDNPGDSVAFTVPTFTSAGNGFAIGSIADYMGLPTIGQPTAPLTVNGLPMRGYNLIYNTWYRDENLINRALQVDSDAAQTENSNWVVRRRAKSHDYFTSCLPWPQKFIAPSIASPVTGLGVDAVDAPTVGPFSIRETPSVLAPVTGARNYANAYRSSTDILYAESATNSATSPLAVFAQTDVNLFREAMQVQVFLERMARGGTRYTEITENIFGVRNPDARLQRPEYIGGGSTPLQFTPIAQTSPNSGTAYLGSLGAAGTAVGNNQASYAATEHGFIICMCSVKSELSYSQGVHRMWDRSTLYDYYNPAFAGLGEQAVLRREIFATGAAANDDVVFGYQERWHELRTHYSTVAGLFRPTAAGNVDEWHLSQLFSPAPTLGQTFIEDTPPMTRVFAAGAAANGQHYLADVQVSVEMTRPLPVYGTPVGLGRF